MTTHGLAEQLVLRIDIRHLLPNATDYQQSQSPPREKA